MRFEPSEEQALVKASVARLLGERYRAADRRAYLAGDEGWSRARWRDYADLGLLDLRCATGPGAHDDLVIAALLHEAYGTALILEPCLPTAIHARALLAASQAPAAADLLDEAARGRRVLAVGDPVDARAASRITAVPLTGGWSLSGACPMVLHGGSADVLLVVASPPDGPAVFAVERGAAGLRVDARRLADGHGIADLELASVRVAGEDRLLHGPGVAQALEDARHVVLLALCAEAVGAMEALLRLTCDHLATRRQFGRPLAGQQVLRHRAADMYVRTEQARSMLLHAVVAACDADRATRARGLHAAKALVGRLGREVGEAAVQLHGGMGLADEHVAGHYFKRLVAIDLAYGDERHHLRRLAALGGLLAPREDA